ncbi:MAG TPA: class II glutamine amidotransferase [Pseudomonadales bacterium]|nr:class II glutamine amidotransferase [Pseudomonadales bacterium]
MCRLYALLASEPTRVGCSLACSQNNLMRQSAGDADGVQHAHGWGVAEYTHRGPVVERQAWAAYDGERFSQRVARIRSRAVVAHVRRATVGSLSVDNTHPFRHGRFTFAHNGTLPAFDRLKPRLLAATSQRHRSAICGQTDSEHLFHYLLSRWSRERSTDLLATIRDGIAQVLDWCHELAPGSPIGLNVLLTDGEQMVASRYGRSLWFLEHDTAGSCRQCGQSHVERSSCAAYRAVEVASEPITPGDAWRLLPEACVLGIDASLALRIELVARNHLPAPARLAAG